MTVNGVRLEDILKARKTDNIKKTAKKKTTSSKVNKKTATPTPPISEKNKLWRYMTKKTVEVCNEDNRTETPQDNPTTLKVKTTPLENEDNIATHAEETTKENETETVTKLTFTTSSDRPSVTEKIRKFQSMTDSGGGGGVMCEGEWPLYDP